VSLKHRFPGLVDGWVRLDGAGGTLVVDTAIEAMTDFLRSPASSNLGGDFAASRACGELVDRARAAVAGLVGARADQVVFGPNSTTLVMAYTRALGRLLQPGDQIVCTQLDHDSNITPWSLMAADVGAEVVMWPLDPSRGLDTDVLASLLDGGRVRWVAISGASNLTGAVPPIAEIVAAAHGHGARVHLDAVARVPHLPTHHAALGVDSLVSSSYKWFGPHAGALVLSDDLLATVEPYRVRPADYGGVRGFETGTPSFEDFAGVVAAAEFMAETNASSAGAEEAMLARLERGLDDLRGVTTYAPPPASERAPTAIFTVEGHRPEAVAAHLADHEIAVWAGHCYAVELIDALGLTAGGGAVRASIVRYNDEPDIDRLLESLAGLGIVSTR
jgi:cysteine desulfurase family protein (TIGR01976 family)